MCLDSRTTWRLEFRAQLEKEYSTENLDFIEAVEDYQKSPNFVKKRQIYERFIATGAPDIINISSSERDDISLQM